MAIIPFLNNNEKSVNYSKTSNTLSTTLQVREPGETLLGWQLSRWGSDLKASWKKRILMWLSCKVAQVAQCESLKLCTGGMKNTRGMTENSMGWWWPQKLQAAQSQGCSPDPPPGDGRETRCPGLHKRQDLLFQLLGELSASSLELSAFSGIASPKVTHQRQTEARGIKAKPFWPKAGQIWWAVWTPNLLCHIQLSLCPSASFLCLP